jgi:hypothetical protein
MKWASELAVPSSNGEKYLEARRIALSKLV